MATTSKRKNPADLTGRNLRAAKRYNFTQDLRHQTLVRAVVALTKRVHDLSTLVIEHEVRLARIERPPTKRR